MDCKIIVNITGNLRDLDHIGVMQKDGLRLWEKVQACIGEYFGDAASTQLDYAHADYVSIKLNYRWIIYVDEDSVCQCIELITKLFQSEECVKDLAIERACGRRYDNDVRITATLGYSH